MNILAINATKSEKYPELRIPGGVSHAIFYPKKENPDSYIVFVTLDYSNKMAVIDLDLAKKGDISDVKYIENVDFLDSMPHGASRKLFISGKWIISPASKNKTVVIINADTQKVHGKVSAVNGGDLAVWVKDSGVSGIGSPWSLIVFLVFLSANSLQWYKHNGTIDPLHWRHNPQSCPPNLASSNRHASVRWLYMVVIWLTKTANEVLSKFLTKITSFWNLFNYIFVRQFLSVTSSAKGLLHKYNCLMFTYRLHGKYGA